MAKGIYVDRETVYGPCVECGERVLNYLTECPQHHHCELWEVGCHNLHDIVPPAHCPV
jgi:hypothetical protein